MPQPPLGVSKIFIGSDNNTISRHADGSMLFSDPFVPGIKLKDLLGGTIIIEPSVLVIVETSDWILDPVYHLYAIDVPHSFGLVGNQKAQVLTVTMDSNFNQILMDTVQSKENSVYIRSTSPLDIYVSMKRI